MKHYKFYVNTWVLFISHLIINMNKESKSKILRFQAFCIRVQHIVSSRKIYK